MRIHFISIGGSAMHNLAIALKQKGYVITGSDDEINEPSKSRLQVQGLLPAEIGWHPGQITSDIDEVILGMHARADNPELLKAKELGLRIYSYPEYIYEQSKDKIRVVIGGSHGKTTTTAIIMHVLHQAGTDFDYLAGASLPGFDQTVRLSHEAPVMIIEGDEYLSSPIDLRPKFHLYRANMAVLTGIAWDHVNVFPTYDIYKEQFSKFIDTMSDDGYLVYYEGDADLKKIVEEHKKPMVKQPYGMPVHSVREGITWLKASNGSEYELEIFGDHNLLNLNAAYYICMKLGVREEVFYKAVSSFKGASRRLELMASNEHTRIYWDFAHSPSKLSATTRAVKEQFPKRTLVACMELHTFSSLNPEFLSQYVGSMDEADIALVYFNPHTLEHKKLPPLTDNIVKLAFKREDLLVFISSEKLKTYLEQLDLNESTLLLMSSGNFDGLNIKQFALSLI